MHEVTLATLANGGLMERFEDAFRQVLANIQDPNTPAKAKRKVKIELTLSPDKDRAAAGVQVEVTTKLSPHESLSTTIFMGFEKNNVIVAREHNPKQPGLFGEIRKLREVKENA